VVSATDAPAFRSLGARVLLRKSQVEAVGAYVSYASQMLGVLAGRYVASSASVHGVDAGSKPPLTSIANTAGLPRPI
jgi:hypothetical protein